MGGGITGSFGSPEEGSMASGMEGVIVLSDGGLTGRGLEQTDPRRRVLERKHLSEKDADGPQPERSGEQPKANGTNLTDIHGFMKNSRFILQVGPSVQISIFPFRIITDLRSLGNVNSGGMTRRARRLGGIAPL
jgi:hypothetical protein